MTRRTPPRSVLVGHLMVALSVHMTAAVDAVRAGADPAILDTLAVVVEAARAIADDEAP
ncbi:hypothetical protein [Thalassobaculum sp.]|uniref:hypothetical protein n=1 Tax=Thalassobaculum sp. TaxID=2022740 RepID=UPI0032EDCCD4